MILYKQEKRIFVIQSADRCQYITPIFSNLFIGMFEMYQKIEIEKFLVYVNGGEEVGVEDSWVCKDLNYKIDARTVMLILLYLIFNLDKRLLIFR